MPEFVTCGCGKVYDPTTHTAHCPNHPAITHAPPPPPPPPPGPKPDQTVQESEVLQFTPPPPKVIG